MSDQREWHLFDGNLSGPCSEEADENAERSCLLHRQEVEPLLRAALEVTD